MRRPAPVEGEDSRSASYNAKNEYITIEDDEPVIH
jgi:hypothetical protein